MKLYYAETLAPRKVCAVTGYLGLPIEYRFVDLLHGENMKPSYLAINPNGKVPTLVDGDRSEGFAQVQRWHEQLNSLDGWRNPFPARFAREAATH